MHIPPSLRLNNPRHSFTLPSLNGKPAHPLLSPLLDLRKDLRRRHSRGSIITHAAQDESGGAKPETEGKGVYQRAGGLWSSGCGLWALVTLGL